MTLNEIEAYCLSKPGAYLDWPFGPEYAVVKVKALLDGTVPNDILIEMIDHSYSVVISKLPKKARKELEAAHET